MRLSLVERLVCPNMRQGTLECAVIDGEDDVSRGVLFCRDSESAYPIVDSIPILLSDDDTAADRHAGLLKDLSPHCPSDVQEIIERTVARLSNRGTSDRGEWNREEMEYFDGLVGTEEARQETLESFKNKPNWNVYLPREAHLLRNLRESRSILEVGCGASRTMAWATQLDGYSFDIVGVDISFKVLMVAKAANDKADFIQASALNLPFKDSAFDAVLAFGSLHHLQDPIEGLNECVRCAANKIGFHEPIDTPRLLSDGSALKNLVARIMDSHDHSDHDDEISVTDTLHELQRHGCEIVVRNEAVTIAKPLMKRLCDLISNNTWRKHAYRLMFLLDSAVVHTLCQVSRRFGPRAMILLAQKN